MRIPYAALSSTQTAAFTGYRPQKLPKGGSAEVQKYLSALLHRAIVRCIAQGYTTFLNGCMAGWDVLTAEAALALKPLYPQIRCVTAAPFRQGFFAAPHWTPEWKRRVLQVYRQSDMAFCLSERYYPGVYFARNRFLVEHASLILCYFDGKPGGTRYTVGCAAAQGKTIINLAERRKLYGNEYF